MIEAKEVIEFSLNENKEVVTKHKGFVIDFSKDQLELLRQSAARKGKTLEMYMDELQQKCTSQLADNLLKGLAKYQKDATKEKKDLSSG